jgi:multicopper oxidase
MALDRRSFLRAGSVGILGAGALPTACTRQASQAAGTDRLARDTTMTATESDIDLGGGVVVRTWSWDGQVPGKEIRLTRGQTMRAELVNNLPHDTTIHWHGLAIPNAMDGVPVLTQQPVAPQGRFRYGFTVPDAGTYWAHSHFGSQLDRGLYAPLIIEDPQDGSDYDDELVLVLDDWIDGTGTNPDEVLAKLRQTGMKKMAGGPGVSPDMPMGDDGGDVTYPYFVINGRVPAEPQVADYKPGQRIRLRIINAGGDTAFRVGIPGIPLTVTHTDGYPVVTQQAGSVLLGMGERADAIITIGDTSVPVVAAPYGKDGHAQLNLRVNRAPLAGGAADVEAFVAALARQAPLNTATLVPTPAVTLPAQTPDNVLDVRLTGPVNGYNWLINDQAYDPDHPGLPVTQGQRVRIRFVNKSMMFHPMHLHGHTFEVQGADGPRARKDTVLVAPLQTVEVDFRADNPGKWISHCHNEYHLDAGMATYIAYQG